MIWLISLIPIGCIIFAFLVDSNYVFGVFAIVALLIYVIVQKIKSNKKAKEMYKDLFK